MKQSLATPDDIEQYTQGECHVFAVALHRITQWPMLVVIDGSEAYWTDPTDDDNFISSVVHVLCVDPDGNAWDVRGSRPLADLREEMLDAFYPIHSYDTDLCPTEEDLSVYVGCWGEDSFGDEIDRPLYGYDEGDVAEAREAVLRTLTDLHDFGLAPAEPVTAL